MSSFVDAKRGAEFTTKRSADVGFPIRHISCIGRRGLLIGSRAATGGLRKMQGDFTFRDRRCNYYTSKNRRLRACPAVVQTAKRLGLLRCRGVNGTPFAQSFPHDSQKRRSGSGDLT